MNNIIPPEPSLGKIKYEKEVFEISEAEIVIEKISENNLLYISAIASHYELHDESKVYVQDLGFSLLMPTTLNTLENCKINFPKSDSNHPEWEKAINSNFYRFEHLLITECEIEITESDEGYQLELSGESGEGIGSNYGGFKFEASLFAQQKDKIDRNKNYFLPN